MAAVRTTRAALPVMLAAGRGTIVNTSSVNAFLPDPGVLDYSAAKAALASFSKSLSKEVGPRGVRVNTISPGPVATDLWLGDHGVAATVSQATGASPQDVERQAAHQSVTGRFSRPVLPGESLTISIWEQGDGEPALFQTARADGEVVIDRGRATVRPGAGA